MKLRLAEINDLKIIKEIYTNIIENMNSNNINIWDDIYPCEFFEEDIKNKQLYVLVNENDKIMGAFALSGANSGESYIKWKDTEAKALYIDRLGVNVDYLRRGIGSIMISEAVKKAKEKEAEYLRLFVVDINKPAINLYLNNGFNQVEGLYEEKIDDFILREYGFEIEL